eukprot:CAMPEP_0201187004 /NCGR_PEP_ID=MMETSP0851-20130426/132618_1 /ASSEMBLY_ACC=CAM_ASM_000631 /TAXON_ID=183588 /ORGANISM="Pseudo-nitzschia fraudulenta, Strain WWA7" /LENGTH=485 /DNA_ID=CAMNT_0047472411 /DNA_START=21 /DNA_END=1478 /DNA_ORIENTATION=-
MVARPQISKTAAKVATIKASFIDQASKTTMPVDGAVGGILSSSSAAASTTSNAFVSTAASVLTNPAVNAATRASLELVVSSAVGIASIDRGLLNTAIIKALSQTTFKILLPLFLGTSIVKTITKYGLTKSSLAVPALAAIQSFVLYVVTIRLLYPLFLSEEERDSDDARGTAVCASFGNAGVVPLIFCDSLFRATSLSSDNLALSTGFVSMFLVGWSPFFWSFGRSVLLDSSSSSGGGGGVESKNRRKRIGAATTTTRKEEIFDSIKIMLPPPVLGVLVGIVVATIPILRTLFVGGTGVGELSSTTATTTPALLGVVFDTAQNFGKAASPLSLLVLVSSLALGAGFGNKGLPSAPPAKKTGRGRDSTTTISFPKRWGIVSLSRFIVSPLLMLGLLKAASSPRVFLGALGEDKGLIGTSLEQPMLWFVCLLESCMPPAQNQVMMLQVANEMKQANEMATFLFSVYATSMIPLTVVISIALDNFKLL